MGVGVDELKSMVKYFRLFRVPAESQTRHLANTVANLEPGPFSALTWRIVPKLLLGLQNAGFISYSGGPEFKPRSANLTEVFWGFPHFI